MVLLRLCLDMTKCSDDLGHVICWCWSWYQHSHLFRVHFASVCWQALWRCKFSFPAWFGICPQCHINWCTHWANMCATYMANHLPKMWTMQCTNHIYIIYTFVCVCVCGCWCTNGRCCDTLWYLNKCFILLFLVLSIVCIIPI